MRMSTELFFQIDADLSHSNVINYALHYISNDSINFLKKYMTDYKYNVSIDHANEVTLIDLKFYLLEKYQTIFAMKYSQDIISLGLDYRIV